MVFVSTVMLTLVSSIAYVAVILAGAGARCASVA